MSIERQETQRQRGLSAKVDKELVKSFVSPSELTKWQQSVIRRFSMRRVSKDGKK